MKHCNRFITLVLTVLLVLGLCACGDTTPDTTVPVETTVPTEPPLTADQVFAFVQAAMDDAEATRMFMEMTFGMRYTEGSGEDAVETEVSYALKMDTMFSEKPFGAYATAMMNISAGDFSMDISVDEYIVEENDSVVTYTKMFDMWGREDTQMRVKEYLASTMALTISTENVWSTVTEPANLVLEPETTVHNEIEVHILRADITASGLGEAFATMGFELGEELDTVTIPVVYYVNAQDYTVVRAEVDMQPLADLMAATMLGVEELQGMEFEMQLQDAVYELGYGFQKIPEVPQEAYDFLAEQETAPENTEFEIVPSEGPFTLNCGSKDYTITCPEGWMGEAYSADNVWIYNEDYTLCADYYYLQNWTESDVYETFVQADLNGFDLAEIPYTFGEGPAIDGYTTYAIISEGESFYYAWTKLDGGWLLTYVYDYTGTDDATQLLPQMLGQIVPAA